MNETLTLKDLGTFVEKFLGKAPSFEDRATVIGLYGNLGSGKTTFTKEVAKQLGVKETVTSPTFTLQSNYNTSSSKFKKLIHIDLYRIEDIDEIKILRLEELFMEPRTLVLIEWMDKITKQKERREKGEDFIKIQFEHVDENNRKVKIEW